MLAEDADLIFESREKDTHENEIWLIQCRQLQNVCNLTT